MGFYAELEFRKSAASETNREWEGKEQRLEGTRESFEAPHNYAYQLFGASPACRSASDNNSSETGGRASLQRLRAS